MKTAPATATKSETMKLDELLRTIKDTASRAEDVYWNQGNAELAEEIEHLLTLARQLPKHLDDIAGTDWRDAYSTGDEPAVADDTLI